MLQITEEAKMEVMLMESDAYQILLERLDKISSQIRKTAYENQPKQWIDNAELCKQLSISKRTAQTYRDKKLISYSQVGSKILYKSADVEAFLLKHHIKSTLS